MHQKDARRCTPKEGTFVTGSLSAVRLTLMSLPPLSPCPPVPRSLRLHDTGLHGALQAAGVRRLVVAGVATEYCVLYTVRDAVRLGYEVSGAVGAATRAVHNSAEHYKFTALVLGWHILQRKPRMLFVGSGVFRRSY